MEGFSCGSVGEGSNTVTAAAWATAVTQVPSLTWGRPHAGGGAGVFNPGRGRGWAPGLPRGPPRAGGRPRGGGGGGGGGGGQKEWIDVRV